MFVQLKRKLTAMKKVNTLFFFVCFGLINFIALGYSALSQNLMITGDVGYFLESKKLYDILMRESRMNRLAREYTGAHQDSLSGTGDKDIFYYYATTADEGDSILNRNNVIFAGHCWQMIRTTDTGGVKMLYNGEPVDDQCLNTRGTHVGYSGRSSQTLNSSYYYGTNYTYDSENQVFQLVGTLTQATWDATTGPTLVGKYTCKSATQNGTCATLYLIESYSNETSGYALAINANSPYSQFGNLPFNVAIDSLAYTGYMYNTVYSTQTMTLDTTTYKYASDFTYSNGTYTLNSDSVSFAGSGDSDIESLSTHHYTCWNTTGTCSSISYVYLYDEGVLSYISFADGKNINDAINDMIFNNGVNVKNSIMKTGVEAWYASHLEPYSSYIEDAVYCNNRTIRNLGAWNPDGGTVLQSASPWLRLLGVEDTNTTLSCPNVTDQFTTTNPLARSSYKVGLITRPELALLNNDNARASAAIYYALSPYGFMDVASIRRVNPPGDVGSTRPTSNMGVRPVISLVYGTEYVVGDGSMANPYIVDDVIANTNWDYDYKEEIQTFKVPQDGIYRLEAWGAQGGDAVSTGGGGGYAYGTVLLSRGTILYIVTGGAGTQSAANSTYVTGGYNGGGSANYSAGTGGGATHIATSTGLLTEFSEKQNDMLLVAGGAGGGGGAYADTTTGGCGGGSTGCTGGHYSSTYQGGGAGATQTAGGSPGAGSTAGTAGTFGQGGNGGYATNEHQGSGGGGGGWYGGGGGSTRDGGGGGGSGYANRDVLITGELIAGSLSFGDPNGEAVKGHFGSGYVRITRLESYEVKVKSNDINKGQVSPSSKIIKVNDDAEFTLTANSGYTYASNTCGGTVSGNTLIIENITKNITCTVTFNETMTFDYTGGEQTYTVPADGIYRLEVWGAQGGSASTYTGGYGAYSVGEMYLTEDTILYINVGGQGTTVSTAVNANGGYNGGGAMAYNHSSAAFSIGSGGGATHIATGSGLLSAFSSTQDSLLIVAGGGGGSDYWAGTSSISAQYGLGGTGGGIQGNSGTSNGGHVIGTGGTQTASGTGGGTGSFGIGGNASTASPGGAGGGGGYFGGGGSADNAGGGGGSGYIGNSSLTSKHMTCYNCTTSDEVSTKTVSNSNVSATALSEYAKEGNGYAKITYVTNQTYTVSAISANEDKATISPNSRKVRLNSNAEFLVNLNTGYGYISDTCGGFMQGNILIIPNVKSDKNCIVDFGELFIFDYTGGEQVFTAPKTGYFKLKVWGAQGGDTTAQYHGGYGGYATGSVFLQKNDLLYVNVGGRGVCAPEEETSAGGYNGGGGALTAGGGTGKQQCSGGGASHIAKSTGLLSTFENNKGNLLIVAGGGGGAGYQSGMYDNPNGTHGGNGGGIEGALVRNECTDCGTLTPATQTHAGIGRFGSGSFGLGSGTTAETSSGGGGGYYGGGSDTYEWGGSGGSGYIGNSQLTDKHMACYNCVESTEENTYTKSNRKAYEFAVEDASKIGPGHVEILYIEIEDYFTLSYHDNSGLGCDGTTTRTKSYREWGELCTPTRDGYEFKEWNTSADGTGNTITSTTDSLQDEDVYAIWLPVYRITYNSNGGSVCDPTYKDQIQGTAWGTLCNPIQSGYGFRGWNTAQDGSGTTITSSSIASSNLTVYAQWIEITTTSWTYSYTGGQQTFTAPYPGTYKIELYGAQGTSGGRGAYVYGNVELNMGTTYYIYVGGSNGWNGGGSSGNGGHGGGATDIRLTSGNLYSRIMVAGGGGSYSSGNTNACNYPGSNTCGQGTPGAAGLTSGSAATYAYQKEVVYNSSGDADRGLTTTGNGGGGGSQTGGGGGGSGTASGKYGSNTSATGGGGSFGNGGSGTELHSSTIHYCYSGAGGGGYYGGGGGGVAMHISNDQKYVVRACAGGGGGSSYINGVSGYTRNGSATYAANQYVFTSSGGSAGNRSGNGYASITYIG